MSTLNISHNPVLSKTDEKRSVFFNGENNALSDSSRDLRHIAPFKHAITLFIVNYKVTVFIQKVRRFTSWKHSKEN